MRRLLASLICASFFAACGGAKAPVNEDFSTLAGLDQKSDAFSYRMKILGSLDYGQTSDAVAYHNKPRFRAFKFGGQAGDKVDAWVRSTNGGDAVAWILDNGYNVLGSNDDADDSTLDAHVTATLTANTNPSIITYYVVYRDYSLDDALFTVALNVQNDFFSCHADADCIAVPARMCCSDCSMAAINKDQKDAYQNQDLGCPAHQICPLACRLDTRVAECNATTNRCEMVEISNIACGGFIATAHTCPAGYDCQLPVSHPDVPGTCQPADPSTADCRQSGCTTGDHCQICWGSYACVPDGAEC